MRSLKVLGLAVCASVLALAVLGACSASATSLCKKNESPCSAGNTYSIGTSLKTKLAAGTKTTFGAGIIEEDCEESEILGETTNSGTPLLGRVTAVLFSFCSCERAVAVHLPWQLKIEAIGGGDGTLTATSGGNGNPGFEVECSGVKCVYETPKVSSAFNPGSPALWEVNSKMVLNASKSAFICTFVGEGIWLGEYQFTAPSPLFITS